MFVENSHLTWVSLFLHSCHLNLSPPGWETGLCAPKLPKETFPSSPTFRPHPKGWVMDQGSHLSFHPQFLSSQHFFVELELSSSASPLAQTRGFYSTVSGLFTSVMSQNAKSHCKSKRGTTLCFLVISSAGLLWPPCLEKMTSKNDSLVQYCVWVCVSFMTLIITYSHDIYCLEMWVLSTCMETRVMPILLIFIIIKIEDSVTNIVSTE